MNTARALFVLLSALFLTQMAAAQARYPTLEDARRATRCTLLFAMAARDAPGEKARESNLTARRLALKLGSLSAGQQLMSSWLDELEKDIPSLHGEALVALNEDCKRLMREYRETLAYLLEKERE